MKIAYIHNLPLEYYPPATNALDMMSKDKEAEVRVITTPNLKNREAYCNGALKIFRYRSPDPKDHQTFRLAVALWWHLRTAWSLLIFRPDAVIYIEPHSALAVYIYLRFLLGKARLFIHHHEYYDPGDYLRPGMRLPRLGSRLEASFLFPRAVWISQTNADRLQMMKAHHPEIAGAVWRVLPNYPPAGWLSRIRPKGKRRKDSPLRLVYIGSASFRDTYIEEIVRWAALHRGVIELHICGYNISEDVWNWLEAGRFSNVTFDKSGYVYDELPDILAAFDVGLVLYKGNTRNFVYNVPNKVFEYLACGLEVWYPREMAGMRNFHKENPAIMRELDFRSLRLRHPKDLQAGRPEFQGEMRYRADKALEPLFDQLGLTVE